MAKTTVTAEEHASQLQAALDQANAALEIAQHRISELSSYEPEVRLLRDQVAGLLAEHEQIGAALDAAQRGEAAAVATARDANTASATANVKVQAAEQLAAAIKVLSK